jgi:hypothetical protein
MERASSRHTTTGVDVSRIAQMVQGQQLNSSSLIQAWIVGIVAFMLSVLTLFFGSLQTLFTTLRFSILMFTFYQTQPTPALTPVSSDPIDTLR